MVRGRNRSMGKKMVKFKDRMDMGMVRVRIAGKVRNMVRVKVAGKIKEIRMNQAVLFRGYENIGKNSWSGARAEAGIGAWPSSWSWARSWSGSRTGSRSRVWSDSRRRFA
jgi:hypothetical protein